MMLKTRIEESAEGLRKALVELDTQLKWAILERVKQFGDYRKAEDSSEIAEGLLKNYPCLSTVATYTSLVEKVSSLCEALFRERKVCKIVDYDGAPRYLPVDERAEKVRGELESVGKEFFSKERKELREVEPSECYQLSGRAVKEIQVENVELTSEVVGVGKGGGGEG